MKQTLRTMNWIVCVFAMMIGQRAEAQWALGLEEPWTSAIDDRKIDDLDKALKLSDDERVVVDTLYKDHQLAFKAFVDDARTVERTMTAEVRAAPIGSDEARKAEIAFLKKMSEFADCQALLDEEFWDNLQAALSDGTQPAMMAYLNERRWTRLAEFASMVPGAKVNLNLIVDKASVAPEVLQKLEPILADYNVVMESVLDQMFAANVRMNRLQWKRMEQVSRMNEKLRGASTPEEYEARGHGFARRWMRPVHSARMAEFAVRQVNLGYAELIAAELPEESAAQFRVALNRAKHPNAFVNNTRADAFADQVGHIESLSAIQSEAVVGVMAEYRSALSSINERAASLEEVAFQQWLASSVDQPTPITPEARELFAARKALVAKTIEKLYSILTTEQQKRVPTPLLSPR